LTRHFGPAKLAVHRFAATGFCIKGTFWAVYAHSEPKTLVANGIGNYATLQNLEGPGTVSFEVQADGY
jgi:hypothetical protein